MRNTSASDSRHVNKFMRFRSLLRQDRAPRWFAPVPEVGCRGISARPHKAGTIEDEIVSVVCETLCFLCGRGMSPDYLLI